MADTPPIERLDPAAFVGGERKTAQYRPQVVGGDWYGMALDGRPYFTLREADRMRKDPQCQFAMRILRAPLYRVASLTSVETDNPRAGRFALTQFRNIWEHSLRRMLTSSFTYGPAVGETTYRVSRGQIVFDRWDDIHPRDAMPLEWLRGKRKGQFAGIRVKGGTNDSNPSAWSKGGAFDLQAPHAFWYSGETEYGAYWSRPRLAGMFEPWLEKRGRHGAVDCRRLWFKKGAFSGGSMRYPLGFTEVDNGDGTSSSINNQDIAREIVEKFESGGILALPNVVDTKGNYVWIFEPPKSGGEVGNIIEYPKQLDREILIGAGVVPEMVEAATVGSGYSGRSIPAQVFMSSEDEIAQLLIDCIDRQQVRNMVKANFGNVRYRLRAKSLAELIASQDDKSNGQMLQEPDERQAVGGGLTSREKPPGGGPVQLSHVAAKKIVKRLRQYEREIRLSFAEADHPRDDHGRFVSKEDLAAAKTDPKKAEELRKRVTDPAERKKLESHLNPEPEKSGGGSEGDFSKHPVHQVLDTIHAARERLKTDEKMTSQDVTKMLEPIKKHGKSHLAAALTALGYKVPPKNVDDAFRKIVTHTLAVQAAVDRSDA
jgi:hypothetical protein